jgi:hypothetical protein
METRNASVTAQLINDYGDRFAGSTVHVFCVSNTDYWEKRGQPRDLALPFLQLSGILAVRKHCLSIVGESQLRIAATYVADEIPAHLADVELWVQSGECSASAEQKRRVRATLDAVEEELVEVKWGLFLPVLSRWLVCSSGS